MKNIKTYEEFEEGVTFKEYLNKNPKDFIDIEIVCIRKNLIDLNGVDVFSYLTTLICHHNKLTTLKDIIKLERLDILGCSYNSITSLEGIENLTNLRDLYCHHNKITSLKGIENLINLEELYCEDNPIDWFDYIDEKGNIWYTKLPKSITKLYSDKFKTINDYWEFMDKNQPVSVSRKFNF